MHHRKPKSRAEDGCDIFEVSVTLRVIISKHDSFQNVFGTADLFATKLGTLSLQVTVLCEKERRWGGGGGGGRKKEKKKKTRSLAQIKSKGHSKGSFSESFNLCCDPDP